MTHQFNQTAQAQIPRSSFDRSHTLKTAFDAGKLIPIYVDEVLPGDTHSVRASFYGRLATLQKPILDGLFMDSFFFFVPNRLVWDNWEKFNGAQENPGDSTDFVVPSIGGSSTSVTVGSVFDYFGLPLGTVEGSDVNALPFRGMNLIWNEWFRDQNLQDSLPVTTGDGPDGWINYDILNRNKKHDYFSSCLPFPQKGEPVTVPLGGLAPVTGIGVAGTSTAASLADIRETGADAPTTYTDIWRGDNVVVEGLDSGGTYPQIYADLELATGFTINDLRQSFQIQRLLERDARGGTRYTEVIRSHFGVTSPDARLQRPEFLGGGSTSMSISPVPQTSQTDPAGPDESPQGNLAGIGVVAARGHGFTKSFTEHGFIIGFVNVRADLTYQQGINRMWSRKTRFDYFWPALSHLGEMPVLRKEIYYDADGSNDEVFGYQESWADYRYKPSITTSIMRSQAPASLDYWHLGLDFADAPLLSDTFIKDQPPVDRVIAVPDEPQVLLDAYFKVRSVRPLPLYGTPGLIDHF